MCKAYLFIVAIGTIAIGLFLNGQGVIASASQFCTHWPMKSWPVDACDINLYNLLMSACIFGIPVKLGCSNITHLQAVPGLCFQGWMFNTMLNIICLNACYFNILSLAIFSIAFVFLHGQSDSDGIRAAWCISITGLFLNGQGVIASASQRGTHRPMKSCDYHWITSPLADWLVRTWDIKLATHWPLKSCDYHWVF